MSNKVGTYCGDNGYTFDDGVYDSVSFHKLCVEEDGDDVSYLDFEYANERNQSRTLSHSSRPQKLKKVSYQPLNLHLTQSPEFMKSIDEYYLQQHKKLKAINFPVSKITIGQWTRVAIYPDDIVAKFYFAKKKLIWEFLDLEEPQTKRLKRKIEIQWDDVSSLREKFHTCDNTGILEVELRKPPTFFKETNPQAGKHTQWKQMDQDFTQNQSSICRRHKLHFQPGILQKNLKKLVSSNSFWSELMKVTFPLHESIYFDIGYGSNNNNNNNSLTYNHGQILSFNDANLQHHSQGTDCLGLEEGIFHMATQFWSNDGMQINSYGDANGWNNTRNEFRVIEAISSSSQVINEDYNMLNGSQMINNLMNQDESGMKNMNEIPMYPQVGSYLANIVFQDVQDLI